MSPGREFMTAESSGGRAARLFREALAIFMGVAAALAGQAWFEDRADRITERELLESVLAEMETNQEFVLANAQRVRGRIAELEAFHEFLGSSAAAQQPDSVLGGAARLLKTGGPGVVSAAIDDALQSGNLRLIRDANLRAVLSRYQDGIRIQRERSDDHQDWTNQRVRTYLVEHARIDNHLEFMDRSLPDSRFSGIGPELLRSREFENLVPEEA